VLAKAQPQGAKEVNDKDRLILMAAVLASVFVSATGLYWLVKLLAYMWGMA